MHKIKFLHFFIFSIICLSASFIPLHKQLNGKYRCLDTGEPTKNEPLHEVPVLCYHQVREWNNSDSKNARTYIIPPERFRHQIRVLINNGYHFILPDQLISYLRSGGELPDKPIMLTFDDASLSQFTSAVPDLNKLGIRAVFFVMTVVLNREKYMSSQQVKTLAEQGHIIGCHTWDHHDVRYFKETDWKIQVEKPLQQLQKITGKPVAYFAYPNGAWNADAIRELKAAGFQGAFQLSGKTDTKDPLFTIRRIIVDSNLNDSKLLAELNHFFK